MLESSAGVDDRDEVLRHIVHEYEAPLRRLALSYASEQAERGDIYQEILIAIWTALPNFRGDSSERTWVYRIAHNTAISASVRCNRRKRHRASYEDGLDVQAGSSSDPEAASLKAEQHRLLIQAVRSMGGLDKQIVLLYLEDLSNRDIAEVVGLSEGAVATRLSRARTTLAQIVYREVKHERR
jgi:RNA polymerase sigma-70 factor (ECF subfamily)